MSDLIKDAFGGGNMKPTYDLAKKIRRIREAEANKNRAPGTSTKVNEKVTVELQTKPKKEG